MVESPLPSGWFRFFDEKKQRFYYSNLKTKQTSYTRPELDEWFLDESIVLNFADIEINHLKELYQEEIQHFKMVTLNQFMDCLREVGERLTKRTVQKLFRGYASDSEKIIKWEHFMLVMDHIKRQRMTTFTQLASGDAALAVSRQLAAALMTGNNAKMGDWVIKFNNTAGRDFYFNTVTNQARWDMPDEVRFFIPPKLEEKMMKIFDFSHINTFKQHFAMLDVDSSGDLTEREMKLFMKALNLNISDSIFTQLIKTIDLNGNGTIEFDEFCWMMYTMSQKEKKGVFEQIDVAASSNSEMDGMMHGNHGYIDFEKVGENLQNLQTKNDVPPESSSRFKIIENVAGGLLKSATKLTKSGGSPESKEQSDESANNEATSIKNNDNTNEITQSTNTNNVLIINTEDNNTVNNNNDNNNNDNDSNASDSSDDESVGSYNEFSPTKGKKKRKPRKIKTKVNQVAVIEEEWEAREERLKKLAEKEKLMSEEEEKRNMEYYFDDGFDHSEDGDRNDEVDDDDDKKSNIFIRTFCKCFVKTKKEIKKKIERVKLEQNNNVNNAHGKYCFCGCRSY